MSSEKIIAFSLWGDDTRYTHGAIRNTQLAKQVYPEWRCVFYTDGTVPTHISETIVEAGGCVRKVIDPSGILMNGMNRSMLRFLAADSDNICIFRDADSRVDFRERSMVDDWLNSGRDMHIIRDHQFHAWAIMAGMWGIRNGVLKGQILPLFNSVVNSQINGQYGIDQCFLRDSVFSRHSISRYVNDEFFDCPDTHCAIERNPLYFVGQAYDGFDKILDKDIYHQDVYRSDYESLRKRNGKK